MRVFSRCTSKEVLANSSSVTFAYSIYYRSMLLRLRGVSRCRCKSVSAENQTKKNPIVTSITNRNMEFVGPRLIAVMEAKVVGEEQDDSVTFDISNWLHSNPKNAACDKRM